MASPRLSSFCRRRYLHCKDQLHSVGRRWGVERWTPGAKGLTALIIVTLLSLLTTLYARQHVLLMMVQDTPGYVQNPTMPAWQEDKSLAQAITISPLIEDQLAATVAQDEVSDGGDDVETSADLMAAVLGDFQPMPDLVLHYVWCGSRFFDFRNYLALKSAIQAVSPYQVMFHHTHLPMADPDGYFTWFHVLRSEFPALHLVPINISETCYAGAYERYALVFDILAEHGGIYVPEDAVLLKVADSFRQMAFVSGIGSCSLRFFAEGLVLARKGQFEIPASPKERVRKVCVCHDDASLHPCSSAERYVVSPPASVPSCVRLASSLFPRDVWTADDKLSTLAKLIAYGRTDLSPRHSRLASDNTPRIGHYLCMDECALSFTQYISILSALHVGGMRRVLIHGPKAPSGVWWERLQQEREDWVFYLHRDFSFAQDPQLTMTNEMRRYIMRTEILLHYGGVFHDDHVIWTQPLPVQLLEYEAVASPDWHAYGNWPESVNHDLLIARGGALYLQRLLKMYQEHAHSATPWMADHFLSYRLIEREPSLVYLYNRLQVKCLNHNCHPTWQPDYRSPFLLNRPGAEFDWRRETLSVHWVDVFPELDLDQVKFTSGFIVDIARHVFKAADIDVDSL